MSRIRILSEQVANQIAAGEVVERPASVVKELVENSIDAGATRIDIHIEGGGTALVRIADNGEGMDGDDILLSLERHATSKLREEGQLSAIATLGFRGEAIPSIASVARVSILSRTGDQEAGTRVEIRYGTLHAVHADGCARGTVIEVRHLFGNMPARKKFLKSQRTELNHIEEVVKNQALAHPHIGFSLQIDGRVSLEYHPDADLEKRTREVFRYSGSLLELQAEEDCQGSVLKVDGYLLLPETGSLASARLRILVNDRPVQDAMIRHAVNEGMQGFLMRGYQPAGILRLGISPDQVDVNVHPAKREIRFRRAEVVHRFVAEQVAQAMQEYQQTLRSSLFSIPTLPQRENWTDGQPGVPLPDPVPAPLLSTAEPLAPEFHSRPVPVPAGPPFPVARTLSTQAPLTETWAAQRPTAPPGDDFSGLTLIGQLFSLYLLAERDGQFLVIDQHAAHERLLYGQLRQGYLAANIPRQALMFPSTVELSPAQTETLERKGSAVIALGLEAELFGEATAVVHSVPAAISHVDPGALLREVLESVRGQADGAGDRSIPQAVDDLLASMACKAAIKAGNRLQPVEMLKLLQQMQASEVFSHCPHGRPVIKTFTAQEVERWFHRHGG